MAALALKIPLLLASSQAPTVIQLIPVGVDIVKIAIVLRDPRPLADAQTSTSPHTGRNPRRPYRYATL